MTTNLLWRRMNQGDHMSATALARSGWTIRCYFRSLLMVATGIVLLAVFWFASRYPQLLGKAQHVGQALPSMAFSSEVLHVAETGPVWQRILASAVNWLHSMKIGMTFGVLFGALLHTVLRYYPLKIAKNLYLN